MSKTSIIFGIAFLLAAFGGLWVYSSWDRYAPTTYVAETVNANGTSTVTTINTSTGTATPGAPVYTLAQVTERNNASSCYTVINGKVYDLTLWVNMHPGGKNPILSLCGADGTEKFMAKHKGAQKQMDILSRFYIGDLTLN